MPKSFVQSDNLSTDRDVIEQLADSFVTRFRTGERPSVEEYAVRYPELAGELRDLLPALVLLEQNASLDDTVVFSGLSTCPTVPTEIGDYTIIRELGRGGMGVVYEAVQQSLGRHVALKVLAKPAVLNPDHLERFRLEARAAARLHHTNIVPVFEVGEHNGLHYYAMQFIQGQSLDLVIDALRQLRSGQTDDQSIVPVDQLSWAVASDLLTGRFQQSVVDTPPVAESVRAIPAGSSIPSGQIELTSNSAGGEFYRSVARVGLQVAEALSYAHGEGILHRDVKPSNLLLDARGCVWVSDFGLARDESVDGLTQTGDIVGTLRYMAPERFAGRSHQCSDVYSLGATLYELLTLRPFLETKVSEPLVEKILNDHPTRPTKHDRLMPRDLETIVVKAISKEPSVRYQTAAAVAEDLRLFLEDRPILARRASTSELFSRWCRRNPAVASLTGAVVTLLIASTLNLAASNSRIRHEANHKDAALAQATAEAEKAHAISKLFLKALESANVEAANRADYKVRRSLDDMASQLSSRHFSDHPDVESAIRASIGHAYRRLEEHDKAEASFAKALELCRKVYGPKDIRAADLMVDHAWSLEEQGRSVEAEAQVREAVEVYRSAEAPPEKVMFGLWTLQRFLLNEKRFRESDAIAAEAQEVARTQGADTPEMASILHTLAASQTSQGQYAQAERNARNSVELHRRLHGPSHQETAWGLEGLARALAHQNKDAEAVIAAEEALTIFRLTNNDWHVTIRETVYFMKDRLLKSGNHRELEAFARGQLHEASKRREMRSDELVASLQLTLANAILANPQYNCEQTESARALIHEQLETSRRLRKTPAYDCWPRLSSAVALIEIAPRLADNQTWTEEFGIVDDSFYAMMFGLLKEFADSQACREQVGHKFRLWAFAMPWRGPAAVHAETALAEAIKTFESLTIDHPEFPSHWHFLADSHRCLGNIYAQNYRHAEAEQQYLASQRLFQIYEQRFGEQRVNDSERARCYLDFADLLNATDRADEAMILLEKGIKLLQQSGADLDAVPRALYTLALTKLQLGDQTGYRASCELLLSHQPTSERLDLRYWLPWTRALAPGSVDSFDYPLKEAARLVQNSPDCARFLTGLGILQYRCGNFEQATQTLSQAVTAAGNESSQETTPLYGKIFLALANWQQGQSSEASEAVAALEPEIDAEMLSTQDWERRATLKLFLPEVQALLTPDQALLQAPAAKDAAGQ